jgi:hypothetical protein
MPNRHHIATLSTAILLLWTGKALAQPRDVSLIEAGRLLDVRTGAYRKHQGILIANGRLPQTSEFAVAPMPR